MPKAKEYCGRKLLHKGQCMTEEAWKAKLLRDAKLKRERINKRQKLVDEWKLSQGCRDCGYAANARALDLDHRDPSLKHRGISELVINSTWAKVWEELQKCEVVCANCHRIRTFRINPIAVSEVPLTGFEPA